jgi:hypothetical protein
MIQRSAQWILYDLLFWGRCVKRRRQTSIKKAISRGIRRGEIRSDAPIDILIDLLTAPCYFRVLFGHARITRPFIETAVDYALPAAGMSCGSAR